VSEQPYPDGAFKGLRNCTHLQKQYLALCQI